MSENDGKALQTTGETSLTFGEKGLQLTNFDDMWRFANMVKRSGMCPADRTPESIMISMQKGSELGFPLLESVHLIPTIKGRPTLEGKGMLALIQARKVDDPRGPVDCGCTGSGDDRVGWCESWRKGWPKSRRTEFTWHQAVTAGLTKPRGQNQADSIYMLYGEDMLTWKAVARHSNKYYGDIMHGLMDTMTATEVYADVKDVTPQTLDELPLTAGEPDPLLAIEGAAEPSDAEVVEPGTGDSGTSEVRKMEPPEKCLAVENGEGCLRKFGHEGAHLCGEMNVPFERDVKALDLEPLPTTTTELLDRTQALGERLTVAEQMEGERARAQCLAEIELHSAKRPDRAGRITDLTAADAEPTQDPNEEPQCFKHLGDGKLCPAPKGHPWDCITGEVFEEEPEHSSETCGKGPSTNPCVQDSGHPGDCDWKLGPEVETPSMI